MRLIDFGVYPSFLVTEKSSKYLRKTELEYIYSSRYQDLKPGILTYYDFVNQALSPVISSKIIERKIMEIGLVRVVYDNDISIIVNYTETKKEYLGILVQPKNYLLIKNGEVLSSGFQEESYE